MLTSDVHPDHAGDPTHALNVAHHYHGPAGPDDFDVDPPHKPSAAQLAIWRECGYAGPA